MFGRSCLTLALVITPATAVGAPSQPASLVEQPQQSSGTLELYGGREGGALQVRGAGTTAGVDLDPGQTVRMQLPSGSYAITGGGAPTSVVVNAGETARYGLPGSPPSPTIPPPSSVEVKQVKKVKKRGPSRRKSGSKWKRVVAPLVSVVLPGGGQMVNGQVGKGFGMFLGAVSLFAGSSALQNAADPLEGARPGQLSDSFRSELLANAGYGVLTGGLHLLYAGQILDAYRVAAGIEKIKPRKRHRVAVEMNRMASVGYRVGDPAADFYADWNVSLMLQVFKRLSVGVGDISFKSGSFNRLTFQAGPRVHYRVFDRNRLWIGLGAGVILQGSVADAQPEALAIDAPPPGREAAFAAIPYGQADFRYFVLDRWSLNIIPRVSAPFGTRFFRGDAAVPKHAATFELGTGVAVYF